MISEGRVCKTMQNLLNLIITYSVVSDLAAVDCIGILPKVIGSFSFIFVNWCHWVLLFDGVLLTVTNLFQSFRFYFLGFEAGCSWRYPEAEPIIAVTPPNRSAGRVNHYPFPTAWLIRGGHPVFLSDWAAVEKESNSSSPATCSLKGHFCIFLSPWISQMQQV